MSKVAKWVVALGSTLVLHVVVLLAVTGVPRPPAIAQEGVGRVAWGPLTGDAARMWRARGSGSLVTWMPDGSGMLTLGSRMLLDTRLHVVSGPGARPDFLPQIPRNALVWSRPGRPYLLLGWDVDGDEQYSLHRWDLADADPVPLTPGRERAVFGAFEPDGDRIAYTSTRRNGRDFDVYVMSARAPAADALVLEREGMWSVVAWSPVADVLLLGRATSSLENELHLFDLASGRVERVADLGAESVRHGSPRWSRDGRALYYTSDRASEFLHARRLDLATGLERVLTADIPWDVLSLQESADGSTLLIAVNEDGRTAHHTSRSDGGSWERLELFESGTFVAALHPDEPRMMVNHVDPLGITRGYVFDLASGAGTRWVGDEPSAGEVPAARLVRYPTFDDVDGAPRTISAFVYPGVGEGPRPVRVDIHGGPEAQASLRPAGSPAQRDGITVITPNVRGSTGYGRTFTTLDDGYLREDAVRDIGALLDWIERQPDMDASRVSVTGGSYGGYMVLASLVHYGARLRCGIDVVGVSNFVTFLENTADYRRDMRRAEYGDERIPEMRAFLESISPANHAERITSRLMVVQGANDPRVPVGESRQIVERVRASGHEVAYVEAADEGHGFRKPWNALWTGLAQRELTRACLLGG